MCTTTLIKGCPYETRIWANLSFDSKFICDIFYFQNKLVGILFTSVSSTLILGDVELASMCVFVSECVCQSCGMWHVTAKGLPGLPSATVTAVDFYTVIG